MSLAVHYASVLRELDPKKVVAYMKAKGHLSLLPRVVRILERTPEKGAVVYVAKKEDAPKYKSGIESALKAVAGGTKHALAVDLKLVGGYSVLANGKAVDRTFRSALVSLYQKIIRD